MALCRIVTRHNPEVYTRCSSQVFGCLFGNKFSSAPASRPQLQLVQSIHSSRALSLESAQFNGHGHYDGQRWGAWKLSALALVGIGGGMLYVKNQMEKVRCAEVAKSEENNGGIWKDFKITLYQYQTCPFCTKARIYLTYCQIPFEIVEVHPIFKKEIKFSEKYKKVPIVTIQTKNEMHELQDSSLIISIFGSYMANHGQRSIQDIMKDYPQSEIIDLEGKKKQIILNKYWVLEEKLDELEILPPHDPRRIEVQWRQWADDHLVHLISPNVYRTYIEAYQAFDHHVKMGRFNGTWEGGVAKVFGSLAMWLISKKLKKKYCKDDDVRVDLYRACNEWTDAMGKKKFMGGDEPNLADLSVYGVLNVMEGLVSFEDVKKYTRIESWYNRVGKAIDAKKCASSVVKAQSSTTLQIQ